MSLKFVILLIIISYPHPNPTQSLCGKNFNNMLLSNWIGIPRQLYNRFIKDFLLKSLFAAKKQQGQIGHYGCDQPRRKRKQHKQIKIVNPTSTKPKRFKRAIKNKTLFRNRKQFQKRRFCPKGKSNCRCWLCDQTGHYANECPDKNKYQDKKQLLKLLWEQGYEPVEEKEHQPEPEVTYVIICDKDDESSSSESEEEDDEETPF